MTSINWLEEIEKRKDNLISDLKGLLHIKSVLDEENATDDAPLGTGVKDALDYMLALGKRDGYQTKDVDALAGHIEAGSGEDLLGILCHVDVVPEGAGWSVDPYGGEIKDGKIYARGTSDNKGPTIAAYYGLKLLQDLDIPLHKRVRMIIGTDEESDWRCVDRYFQTEEMPTIGFAPDADFPIIHAEKGISTFDFVQKPIAETSEKNILQSFQSGRRYNMVPDFATAKIGNIKMSEIQDTFAAFLNEHKVNGRSKEDGTTLILELEGKSAHGMEPNNGTNAGILLATFLTSVELDTQGKQYVTTIHDLFFNQSRGEAFGIAESDEVTGDLTMNVGIFHYEKQNAGSIGVNMRYPISHTFERGTATIEKVIKEKGFTLENITDSKPHHVEKDHELIKTLQKVYAEQTGDEPTLLSIGGATYARSLTSGVAFGALFPGRPDVMHQKDEFMYVDDLLKAASIYAQAIYELTR